ncbi:hypothetical protein [Pseudomonas putida]
MIRFIASLLCQALIGLTLGLFVASLAHATSAPPDLQGKRVRAL